MSDASAAMTPAERAALIADVADALCEALLADANPKPRKQRVVRCDTCGKMRYSSCGVGPCKCGGWMKYSEEAE